MHEICLPQGCFENRNSTRPRLPSRASLGFDSSHISSVAGWGKTLRKTYQTNGGKSQPLSAMALLASFSFLHLSGSFLYGLRNSLRVYVGSTS